MNDWHNHMVTPDYQPEVIHEPVVLCADCGECDPLDGDDFCAACRVRWDADEDAAHAAWLQNKRKTA